MSFADRFRPWHRRNAYLLLLFIAAHLTTHLASIFGADSQSAVMDIVRVVYRSPVIEIVLIALFVSQVCMGIALVIPRIRQSQKTAWSWVQIVSGIYLAIFILNHIFLGVLRGRTYEDVDTGFYFVAATMLSAPYNFGFIPYYFFAILALFSHLAAALHWAGRPRAVTLSLIAVGAVISALIVSAYSGLFYDILLPEAYERYMENLF
jgi:hypothetical protein